MIAHLSLSPQKFLSNCAPVCVVSKRGVRSKMKGKKQKSLDKVIWQHQNVPLQPNDEFEPDEFHPRRLTYAPEYLVKQYARKKGPERPEWYQDKCRHKEPLHTFYPDKYLENEYRDEAVYPEILREQNEAPFWLTDHRKRLAWYKTLKEIPTVDEKNLEISPIPRAMINLKSWFRNHGELPLYQRLTRTNLIQNTLPEGYSLISGVDENLVHTIKPLLLDAIRFHKDPLINHAYKFAKSKRADDTPAERFSERVTEDNMISDINDTIVRAMVREHSHLSSVEMVIDDHIKTWWYADQMPYGAFFPTHYKFLGHKKIDQMVCYTGSACLQLRSNSPLPSIVTESDPICAFDQVPDYEINPVKRRYRIFNRYPSCTPGLWADLKDDPTVKEPHDFPYMSIFGLKDLFKREEIHVPCKADDLKEVSIGKAIMSSFAWLNGLANNHGFTPFHEVTYPFINQGFVTDGQNFTFFVYQMNRKTFHSDIFNYDVCNVCWVSPQMKLYESFEDGQFNQINDDVIRQIVKMYSIRPMKNPAVTYRPYLGADTRSEEQKAETRMFLRKRAGNYHEWPMRSWRYARRKPFFWKLFVDNPDYNTTLWRLQIIPRLKPAEPYYKNWKY